MKGHVYHLGKQTVKPSYLCATPALASLMGMNLAESLGMGAQVTGRVSKAFLIPHVIYKKG